ncbi:MAG: hypothetical protein ACI9OU_002645 [Candidatus Promineifilaceae bacterium]|jgi:hypothetical protein
MKTLSCLASVLVVGGLVTAAVAAGPGGRHSIGGGAHYHKTVDDVKINDIDSDGVGWYGVYQYRGSQAGAIEFDFEFMPDNFGGATNDVYAPQIYLISGKGLYGGVGIGWLYSDSEWADDPFYALRVGFNLELASGVFLDINGNYQFTKWDTDITRDLDTDTVTLGAALRIDL